MKEHKTLQNNLTTDTSILYACLVQTFVLYSRLCSLYSYLSFCLHSYLYEIELLNLNHVIICISITLAFSSLVLLLYLLLPLLKKTTLLVALVISSWHIKTLALSCLYFTLGFYSFCGLHFYLYRTTVPQNEAAFIVFQHIVLVFFNVTVFYLVPYF